MSEEKENAALTADNVSNQDTPEPVSEPELTEEEQRAVSKGWNPKGEFSAQKFMENFTWVKEINRLKDKIDNQQKALEDLVEVNKTISKVQYSKALDDLNRQLDESVAIGDTGSVRSLNEKIFKMKSDEASVSVKSPTIQQKPNYIVEFETRNSEWYNDNTAITSAMKAFARRKDQEILTSNPNIDPDRALRMIEDSVKSEFPNFFGKRNEGTQKAKQSAHSVESGVANTKHSKSKQTIEDLPKESQELARILKKTCKNFDIDKFISDVNICDAHQKR